MYTGLIGVVSSSLSFLCGVNCKSEGVRHEFIKSHIDGEHRNVTDNVFCTHEYTFQSNIRGASVKKRGSAPLYEKIHCRESPRTTIGHLFTKHE